MVRKLLSVNMEEEKLEFKELPEDYRSGAELLEAGFTKEDDRLSEFMREEELPPHNQVFDMSEVKLDKVLGN